MVNKFPAQKNTLRAHFVRDTPQQAAPNQDIYDAIVVARKDLKSPSSNPDQTSKRRKLSPTNETPHRIVHRASPRPPRREEDRGEKHSELFSQTSTVLERTRGVPALGLGQLGASKSEVARERGKEAFLRASVEIKREKHKPTSPRLAVHSSEHHRPNQTNDGVTPFPITQDIGGFQSQSSLRSQIPSSSRLSTLSPALSIPSPTPSEPSMPESPSSSGLGTTEAPYVIKSSQDDEDLEIIEIETQSSPEVEMLEAVLHTDDESESSAAPAISAALQPDEDDDDGSNFSDSPLPSLGDVFGKSRAVSIAPSSRRTVGEPGSGLRRTVRCTSKPSYVSKAIPGVDFAVRPSPQYRFSLSKLVNQNIRDVKFEADLSEARMAFESDPESDSGSAQPDAGALNTSKTIDETLLASVLKEDEDGLGMQKVLSAMDRTEVGLWRAVWLFFKDTTRQVMTPSAFPTPPPHLRDLANSTNRDQAFLSGFAGELFSAAQCPLEIVTWTWDAMLVEPREDLAYAYMAALKSVGSQVGEMISADMRLRDEFDALNARPAATDLNKPVQTIEMPPAKQCTKRELHLGVGRLVMALGNVSNHLFIATRVYAIGVLARMTIDADVSNDCTLLVVIQDALTMLVDSFTDEEAGDAMLDVAKTMLASLNDAVLQNQLIMSLPASSPRIALLRRRLALAFLSKQAWPLQWPSTSDGLKVDLDVQSRFIRLLRRDFNSNAHTRDYKALAASVSLLDVAIDTGFPPQTARPLVDASKARGQPLNEQTNGAIKADEALNERIDAIYEQIDLLFKSIIDTGATHMQRSEAKGMLERLLYRLDYSVRTTPRRKKRPFDEVKESGSGAKVGPKKFIGQGNIAQKDLMAKIFAA